MGRPGTPLGPPGTPLGLLGRPENPRARPWDPPGTPLDAWARPWDPWGRPCDAPGTSLGPRGPPRTPMGPLMEHKHGHISTNRQRQKLSIAVFEAAHQGPLHGGSDRAILSIKRPPKSKNTLGPLPWRRADYLNAQTLSLTYIGDVIDI